MPKLAWDTIDTRLYEAGIDRGVIRSKSGLIFAWSGLVAVNEKDEEGVVTNVFFDGKKVISYKSRGVYEATITGYQLPSQFDTQHRILGRAVREIQGVDEVRPGFYLTSQTKREFDFSYRSMIPGEGYKIHFVWNATIQEESSGATTLDDGSSIETFTWTVTTTPMSETQGPLASSHFVVDGRKISPILLSNFEDYFYGKPAYFPHFPSQIELAEFFTEE